MAVAIAAAGAVIGNAIAPGAIGILGLTGASAGWLAGSLIGSMLFAPSFKTVGPRLDDLKVSGSSYGSVMPYVEGHPRVAGQIVWASDKRPIENTQTQRGGKGGGSKTTVTTYTYEVDLLYMLADVECDALLRVFSGGDLVANFLDTADPTTIVASNADVSWGRLTFYGGGAGQLPDPDYEAAVGLGRAPAYRGRTCVFIKSLNLGSSGQIPNLTFEIARTAEPRISNTLMYESVSGETAMSAAFQQALDDGTSSAWASENRKFGSTALAPGTTAGDYPVGGEIDPVYTEETIARMRRQWLGEFEELGGHNFTIDGWVYLTDRVGLHLFGLRGFCDLFLDENGRVWPSLFTGTSFWYNVGGGGVQSTFADIADINYPTPNGLIFGGDSGISMGFPGGVIPMVSRNPQIVPLNEWVHIAVYRYEGRLFTQVGSSVHEHGWMPHLGGTTFPITTDPAATSPTPVWTTPVYHSVGVPFKQELVPGRWGWFWRMSPTSHTFYEDRFDTNSSGDPKLRFIVGAPPSNSVNPGVGAMTVDAVRYTRGAIFVSHTDVAEVPFDAAPVVDSLAISIYQFDGYPVYAPVDPPVRDVVDRLLQDCANLDVGEFDTSDLSAIPTPVHAMAIGQVTSVRQILESLMACYFFDAVLSDKLYFRRRAQAAVLTIPYADLGWTAGSELVENLPKILGDDLALPQQIALSYSNLEGDQQTDTQHSDRIAHAGQENINVVQVPLAFTASEAKIIADARLLDLYVGLLTSRITLNLSYSELEPTDVVQVLDAVGTPFRLRLLKRTDADCVLGFEAVLDDASIFTQLGLTDGGTPGQTAVPPLPITIMVLLDIPLLRDQDNTPGIYVAVKGSNNQWRSADIFRSDENVTYNYQDTINREAVIGTTTDVLGNWDGGHRFDEHNSVTVEVDRGQLESVQRGQMLLDVSLNAAVVGNELIRFRNAQLVAPGRYRLTGLLRGQKGTEWAISDHVAGERFVLLGYRGMRFVPLQAADIGRQRFFKAASLGQTLANATLGTITPDAVNMKPRSPVHARANRDGADTVITWIRRTRLSTRFGGPTTPAAPLGEGTEAYEVDIYDGPTVVRTVATSTPTFTYTAAEQTADFGAPVDSVDLVVYQVSTIIGRGYPLFATI